MFINKDNTLKWKWVIVGALIMLALIFGCVFWWDKFLYSIIHRPDCNTWTLSYGTLCSIAIIIGKIFSAKVWLSVSFLSVLFFFVYKALRNENDFRYAFVKIKNSYVFYILCSVVLAIITTGLLKVLIGRARPVLFDALGKTFFEPWTFNNVFNSMPSGHTATSFAGLVMIGMSYQMPVSFGIFQGGGDGQFTMKMNLISTWCIVMPLSFAAAFWWKLPVEWVVIVIQSDQIFKCLPTFIHFRKYRWMKKLTRN